MAAVSPLGGVAREQGLAARIEEIGPLGMISVRGDLADAAVRDSVRDAAGLPAPERRRVVAEGERRLCWMAPDELLFVTAADEAGDARQRLGESLGGRRAFVLDMSHARALFRLTGAGARETLAKGAPVDLSPAAFGPGDLRRTHMGPLAAMFWMIGAAPDVFEIVCFRSTAAYLFDWLCTAAAEEARVGAF